MISVTIRSPADYQRAVNQLKTADRYDRATLLEAMLHYDCVTNDNHPCKAEEPDAHDVSAPFDQASRSMSADKDRQQFRASR